MTEERQPTIEDPEWWDAKVEFWVGVVERAEADGDEGVAAEASAGLAFARAAAAERRALAEVAG